MSKQVFFRRNGAFGPNNAATTYASPTQYADDTKTTENDAKAPWRVDGTFRNLLVTLETAPGVGKSWTFTLRINGVDTALTVVVSGTNTTARDVTHSVSIADTDLLSMSIVPSGAPAGGSAGSVHLSVEFDSTTAGESGYCFDGGQGAPGSSGAGNGIFCQNVSFRTQLERVANVVGVAGALKAYSARVTQGQGGQTYDYYIYKSTDHGTTWVKQDGTGGTPDTHAGIASWSGPTQICSASFTLDVNAGDMLYIEHNTSGIVSPYVQLGFRFLATTPGQSNCCGVANDSGSNGAVNYTALEGGIVFGWSGGSDSAQRYLGAISSTILSSFRIRAALAPGSAKSVNYKPQKNGADAGPSITLAGTGTPVFGQDTSTAFQISDGDTFSLAQTPTSSPTLAYISWAFGMVVGPQVVTDAATNVKASSATINGTITPNGIAIDGRFIWGTDNPPTQFETTPQAMGSGGTPVPYLENLTGLTPGVTYYFRAVGNDGVDDIFGAVRSFSISAEVIFDNGVLTTGETLIHIFLRDTSPTTQLTFSDRALPDPDGYENGWKAPRVTRWGKIRRALSNPLTGQYETTDCTVEFDDSDRMFRDLDLSKQLLNARVVIKMIDDASRRLELPWRTVYRGVIRDAKPIGTLLYQITIKDSFAEQFSTTDANNLIPRDTFETVTFPGCANDLANSSAENYQTSASASTGASTVSVDTGVGIFAPGQKFTFAGHLTAYTTSSSTLTDPETSVTFTPDLTNNVADNELITLIPSFTVQPAAGRRIPFGYGYITDRHVVGTDDGDGQGPMTYVGDRVLPDGFTYGEFVWLRHACYSPSNKPFTMLYFWNNALDDMLGGSFYYGATLVTVGDLATEAAVNGRIAVPGYGNWATTNSFGSDSYRDLNGKRYTVLYLRGIFRDWALNILPAPDNLTGGIPFAVAAYGAEKVGDQTGDLIISGLEQYKHIIKNWMPPVGDGYQTGLWLPAPTFDDEPTLSMIDETSFDTAEAQSALYLSGGSPSEAFRGDFIVGANDEAVSARELIARLNVSFGVQSGFNRKIQFFVSMINRTLGSIAVQDPLTYVRDIFAGTFQITPQTQDLFTALRYLHTKDYFNRVTGGWRSVMTGVTETENTDATAAYGAKTTYSTVFLHMIRGKNRASDADDYVDGTLTAAAVLELLLARVSNVQHIAAFQTGPKGFNYELGDTLLATHYEGLGSSGWVEEPIRIERLDIDPTDYTTSPEAYDLLPVLL